MAGTGNRTNQKYSPESNIEEQLKELNILLHEAKNKVTGSKMQITNNHSKPLEKIDWCWWKCKGIPPTDKKQWDCHQQTQTWKSGSKKIQSNITKGAEAVPWPVTFWVSWYIYQDPDFNESTGQCTIRQTDQQKSWLYLAALQCQKTKQSYQIIM